MLKLYLCSVQDREDPRKGSSRVRHSTIGKIHGSVNGFLVLRYGHNTGQSSTVAIAHHKSSKQKRCEQKNRRHHIRPHTGTLLHVEPDHGQQGIAQRDWHLVLRLQQLVATSLDQPDCHGGNNESDQYRDPQGCRERKERSPPRCQESRFWNEYSDSGSTHVMSITCVIVRFSPKTKMNC